MLQLQQLLCWRTRVQLKGSIEPPQSFDLAGDKPAQRLLAT